MQYWWGGGVRKTHLRCLSIFYPSAVSWDSLFLPSPSGWALPSPSMSRHFLLKTLFQLLSLPRVPSLQLRTSGPLPDTLTLQLVGSHRSDCWAAVKLGIPQVLPPPTVTAAASSALPHAPCSPLTSSSSSFSRSSSLGCGQTQRVSGNPDSPQLLSPPCPVRGPTSSAQGTHGQVTVLYGGCR